MPGGVSVARRRGLSGGDRLVGLSSPHALGRVDPTAAGPGPGCRPLGGAHSRGARGAGCDRGHGGAGVPDQAGSAWNVRWGRLGRPGGSSCSLPGGVPNWVAWSTGALSSPPRGRPTWPRAGGNSGGRGRLTGSARGGRPSVRRPLGAANWLSPQFGGHWRPAGGPAAGGRSPRPAVAGAGSGLEARGGGAYTDGSAFDGNDPLLPRAGWAAVLVDSQGRTIRVQSAGVDGPQTSPCAELQAPLWVAECSAGTVLGDTDCELVSKGVTALAADHDGAAAVGLQEGPASTFGAGSLCASRVCGGCRRTWMRPAAE